MLINTNILSIFIAGLMNASFIIPTKYIKPIANEKIWLYHSILGFILIPWFIVLLMHPNAIHSYLVMRPGVISCLLLGGFIFGCGQVCFSYAIRIIGISLSFIANLSVGAVLGSLFVVVYRGELFTIHGGLIILAIFFIIASLIIYYNFSKTCFDKSQLRNNYKLYWWGWLLALLAGCASGLQNITFVLVAFYSRVHFSTGNLFWIWPPFLLSAALPMLVTFGYRINKQSVIDETQRQYFLNVKNLALLMLMGIFFTGSLALYSEGMNNLTHQQQIIGWPLFIISIILASQAWGWIYHETRSKARKSGWLASIILLIIAIGILGLEIK